METVLRQVGDLDQNARSALERMVGHALREDQQVMIQVTDESLVQDSNDKVTQGRLPDWCNIYEGLSTEEIAELERSFIRDSGSRN